MMRSGRSRRVERTRSASVTTPALVRSATQSGAAHCSSRVSSMRMTRSSSCGDLGEQRIGERRLAGAGAAGDQDDCAARRPRCSSVSAWSRREDAVGDIVVERVDLAPPACGWRSRAPSTTGGSSPRSARRVLRQFGADDRDCRHGPPAGHGEATSRMIRSTSRGAEPRAGVDPAFAQPVEPQARHRD